MASLPGGGLIIIPAFFFFRNLRIALCIFPNFVSLKSVRFGGPEASEYVMYIVSY